ncbi:MAG: YiaA/YiaB family inner membrane protein [Actinomycetota bacterium]|nr:YiaA/YiaB family inner membrane protein [Actinomycetota bacterium]
MDVFDAMSKNTNAFFLQAAIAFGVSFLGMLGGIFFLPLDIWPRLFLAMTTVFLVTSAFTLAKVIRDQQEAATIRVRLDEVRMEKLLAEHNPFATESLK